jgi:hypothetical protein
MSVSAAYLEATINTAAVARHHDVEAFVNMSQMTLTQMSIMETTDSPQQSPRRDGRPSRAGAIRPHDRRPVQAHWQSANEHARLRETPCC